MPKILTCEKQTKDYNCGAFGLAAICEAFGLLPIKDNCFLHHRGRSATLQPSHTVLEVAEEIYRISGDIKLTGEHSAEGELANSPSALSYIAKTMGLYVTINTPHEALEVLSQFRDEFIYCANIVDSVSYNEGDYLLPECMECQLVLVKTWNSLHWVAVDSDGVIYDPAIGKTYSDWISLNYYVRLPVWLSFFLK